jgi:hypothetical protein
MHEGIEGCSDVKGEKLGFQKVHLGRLVVESIAAGESWAD